MSSPILFGAAYSVYTRICRLTLEEKGVAYRFEEVDIFVPDGPPAAHMARHPFGKIPAFEDNGFALYESGAISRYIDEAFAGPALQPAAPQQRARMNQAISILDSYAYRSWVWGLFVELVSKPRRGLQPDEETVAAAKAESCCAALGTILADQPFLCGEQISLADLHAAPMLACLVMTEEGRGMIGGNPALDSWWTRLRSRQSLTATKSITDF